MEIKHTYTHTLTSKENVCMCTTTLLDNEGV